MYIVRFVSDDMWRGRVVRKKNKKLEQKRKSLKPRKCSKTFDPFVELMITEVATVTVTILIYFFCYQNNETTISQCFGKYLLSTLLKKSD